MYNINQAFRAELRKSSHQVAARAVMLDTQFREVSGGNFYTAGASELQDLIIDGNVDVDFTRGTRRTAELSILNKSGMFTPADSVNAYTGKFFVNRNVRLYRGVVLAGGTTLYAPIGTFMIDAVDVIVERNISIINLTLSDQWKKFSKSYITSTKLYPVGTHFNTIVKEFAAAAGADYPLAPNLDPLTGPERSAGNTTIAWRQAWTVERGQNRGDLIKDLANKFGIDIYFDVEGRLTTHDRKDPKDAQPVWSFFSSQGTTNGGLISVKRTTSDDLLYNHIFVIGLGDEKAPVVWEKKDTSPTSPTSIQAIGDRVMILEDQNWKTMEQVSAAGQKLWDKKFNVFEDVTLDVICNPALEADDVISVEEEEFSDIKQTYRIVQLNIPLTTSKQTIRVTRDIYDRRVTVGGI